ELVQELKSYTRPIPQDTIQMAPDTVLADTIVKDTLISLQPGVTPIVFSKVEAPNTGNFSDLVQSAANATVAIMNNSEVQGSGIVVSKDGYIVTNDHFFQDSEDVIIRFSNGITLNAKIMKRAPEHDLSLLKVDVDEISALPINHRTIDVQNGAEVFVLGTTQSQQLEQSVNKGLVTAINDSAEVRSFQTDIRIGLGNSGSPLINMNGEIIGIISEKQISGKPEVSSFAIDALYLRTVLGLTIE
ncbi:MAG: trypsin-like peptidase domain-containing protein, partial [Flavobacteriales bacterium]|nr:trypsin-like peptidase domain-containing protein [Flavobacteriales bacterium]